MNQLTFLLAEPRVSHSASQDCAEEWQTSAATWPSNIFVWLNDCAPAGLFGRTSPASAHRDPDGTLVPSSGVWANSGMGGPTEALTLSISVWPSDASVCSLSDILETGDVPQRFFLSQRACAGILRRRKGEKFPAQLKQALTTGAAPKLGKVSSPMCCAPMAEMAADMTSIL